MKFNVRKTLTVGLGLLAMGVATLQSYASETINGAGASFPAPLYQKWIAEYSKIANVRINYQSIGSSGGLAQIRAKTVDFGASDEPLNKETLDKDNLVQFPMIMGAIVVVVNLPDVKAGELKLTGPVVADIFMGKITKWNDPAITALNEGMNLPAIQINVVRRADGSGTTWNFTNYLSKVSPEWEKEYGCNKEIAWFKGSVGGQTNSGVATMVRKIRGAIGYVESAYAFQQNLIYTQLQNADGKFVLPTNETFQAAAANADWKNAPGFYMILTNQPGETSWPIMASSYILVYRKQAKAANAETLLKFFSWAFEKGAPFAEDLKYVPMPANVATMVRESWKSEITGPDGKPVFND